VKKEVKNIDIQIYAEPERQHGGNFKVRSVPDKETVFCLSF
jgi:hypothetical protein